MKYSELYSNISDVLPEALSCDWDNDGEMLCLDADKEIKRVLVALDITLPVIEYAKKGGFDLILSHHPLIFKPIKSISYGDITGKRVCKLINYGISAISLHTRLDVKHVNSALADALELRDIEVLTVDEQPMGRIGYLENEMTCEDFAQFVKEKLSAPYVEYTRIDKKIKRVAILGGSGADAIKEAISMEADCLLTGECGYNKALDSAESGLPVFTAGHFYTENPVCKYLAQLINKIDGAIECEVYSSNMFEVK